MILATKNMSTRVKEIVFQILVHIVIFVSLYFDRNNPTIELKNFCFFFNYVLAALIVNYILLPKFYYKRNYLLFFIFILIVLVGTILIEEMVLEKIFYPDTRGSTFQGIFFTLLDIIPGIFMLVGFKFAWDAFHKQQEVENLKSYVQESELNYLKSQINPHFLFNNLNNLYSYAIEKSEKTPKIILELSSVLRYMLYECQEDYVLLSKEINNLIDYVEINKLQIEDRGVVSLSIDDKQNDNYKIAPLILIVFVENAFKHSQSSMHENIKIDIHLEMTDNEELIFTCSNSYQHSSNVTSLSKGIGLDNVKKRLELLYPKAHKLGIESENDSYNVRLTLSLVK
jgi:hypothetical protein